MCLLAASKLLQQFILRKHVYKETIQKVIKLIRKKVFFPENGKFYKEAVA